MKKISLLTKLLVVVFIFVSGMIFYELRLWMVDPLVFGRHALSSLASVVGVTVGVPANPLNMLVEQIKTKEHLIALREERLNEREVQAIDVPIKQQERKINILLAIGGALFIMVVLNFILDYRRQRPQ